MQGWWNEFFINLFANLLSDLVVGALIYFMITRPDKRKAQEERFKQALGLLKLEIELNRERAKRYIKVLDQNVSDIVSYFPLRFTRGAWNAVKESNLLPQIKNSTLVYYLLRMNESALVANKNLRRLQLSFLENTGANRDLLAKTARKNCEYFIRVANRVLSILDKMDLPDFAPEVLMEEPETSTLGE